MESHILKKQETAGLRNLVLAACLAMLPGFTFGAVLAFLALGVPQFQHHNHTGFTIDLHQASWLRKSSTYHLLSLQI